MVVQIVGLPAWPPPRHVSAGRRLRPNVLALPARVWGLALLIVANWAISHSNILNMAFFMQSEHLGAPWTLGIAIALPALGSIITGGLFARLHHLLGRYIAAAGLVVFCLGFVLLANVHSLGGLMLANVVIGLGGGALVPLILYWTTQAVDDEHHEVALGVVSGCIHVGFIVAPFALDPGCVSRKPSAASLSREYPAATVTPRAARRSEIAAPMPRMPRSPVQLARSCRP